MKKAVVLCTWVWNKHYKRWDLEIANILGRPLLASVEFGWDEKYLIASGNDTAGIKSRKRWRAYVQFRYQTNRLVVRYFRDKKKAFAWVEKQLGVL